ncbi:MAG: hypothetical protein VW455_02310 [Nitrospinota bacterium]
MTDYAALANGIKTTLENDPWITNNVQTIETFKRGFSIQNEKDSLFYAPNDLPALAILPNSEGKQQEIQTTNEIKETVSAQVVAITRHRNAQMGMEDNLSLVQNIERVLEKQKSSTNNLGIDAFVNNVSTTEEQFKKGEYYYFISTITAQIELISSF